MKRRQFIGAIAGAAVAPIAAPAAVKLLETAPVNYYAHVSEASDLSLAALKEALEMFEQMRFSTPARR